MRIQVQYLAYFIISLISRLNLSVVVFILCHICCLKFFDTWRVISIHKEGEVSEESGSIEPRYKEYICGEEALKILPTEPFCLCRFIRRGHLNIFMYYTYTTSEYFSDSLLGNLDDVFMNVNVGVYYWMFWNKFLYFGF